MPQTARQTRSNSVTKKSPKKTQPHLKSPALTTATSARVAYQNLLDHSRVALDALRQKHVRMVWIRTACFLVAAVCLFLGYGNVGYQSQLLTIGWLAALAFFAAIVWHEHLRLAQLRHTSEQRLFERLLARLDRNWNSLPEQRLLDEYRDLACADDLDVAGGASLLSLISLTGTLPGKRVLQSWLAENPTWAQVTKRQQAVQQLIDQRELRLSIIKTVIANSDGSEDVYGLPQWARSPHWLPQHRVAHFLSYLGPGLVATGVVAVSIALASGGRGWLSNVAIGFLGSGLLLNLLVTVFWGSWIHDIFLQVTGTHQATFQFAQVFRSFSDLPHDGGHLDEIRTVTTEDSNCATIGFEKLLWHVRLANLQRDPLKYLVYLVLQLLILWDFRVLKALEGWKSRFGPSTAAWFDALGTCEALISSATVADENRTWTFPRPIQDASLRLRALAMGHPLLPDSLRVENDLTLAAVRPLLLVTGSNMAGKSTFLRALGLNLLLTRVGSPVCATQFETHLYELATSIRVRDSLRDGVSFFMAELQRLKEVVDMAQLRAQDKPADSEHDNPILFLLDEILQGTNSRERQMAVTTVVQRLLGYGATGLLSTHDLDLATVDAIERISQIVHFHEYFENVDGVEVMRFDYKMRPGSTPTTNAMKLLKMVGLE